MMDVSVINSAVIDARVHGDAREDTYRLLADCLVQAHLGAARGAMSVEVGTRQGGSAILQLKLLEALYGPLAPFLVTVDPYGGKPYLGGGEKITPNLYNDKDYLAAKRLLADWPNHVHFSVMSVDFLRMMQAGFRLWRAEKAHWLEARMPAFATVFLDGDHDTGTVLQEVEVFGPMLFSGGRILIDNVDEEKNLVDTLKLAAPSLGLTVTFPIKDAALLVRP